MDIGFDHVHESLEMLNVLMSHMPSAVFIVADENRVVKVNNAFDELFTSDYSGKEYCGNKLGCRYVVEEQVDCGKTSYCNECEINAAITVALEEHKDTIRNEMSREFYIHNQLEFLHLAFTTKHITYHHEDMALIIIDNMTQSELLRIELEEKNRCLNDQKYLLSTMVREQTERIEKLSFATINALERASVLHDSDTGNHIMRVGEYAALIADKIGCDYEFINKMRLYAPLHDIGKVGISDDILKKAGRYTEEEFNKMKQHVQIGVTLLSDSGLDSVAENIVLHHHSKFDGSGYLTNVSGEDIPLEARIVALADVYDALVSKRVYKEAFSDEKAESIIRESSGSHLDPELVEIFFENMDAVKGIRSRFSN